ncbi:MAG TPA: DUF1905 domain-containing protein [Acidimicrobiales bacterium]|nr:DUF1905 domain-containing protein [Acidimicrobiales bacterium]
MSEGFSFSFDVELWAWEAQDSWFFVTVPSEISEEIGVRFGTRAAGFGSIRVEVSIGATTWRTSVFPDKKRGAYVLPVRKQVRKAEGLEGGSRATVALRVVA